MQRTTMRLDLDPKIMYEMKQKSKVISGNNSAVMRNLEEEIGDTLDRKHSVSRSLKKKLDQDNNSKAGNILVEENE